MKASRGGMLNKAQRGVCALCGGRHGALAWGTEPNDPLMATIDHVLPRDRGGYDGPGNLVLAHRACNGAKGRRLPTGCEVIWLLAVCTRLRCPVRLRSDLAWTPPKISQRTAVARHEQTA